MTWRSITGVRKNISVKDLLVSILGSCCSACSRTVPRFCSSEDLVVNSVGDETARGELFGEMMTE